MGVCMVKYMFDCSALSTLSNVSAVIGHRSSKPSLLHFANDLNIPHADDRGDGDDEVNFTDFHINAAPSFLTFGRMIELIYAKSTQVTSYLTTKLSLGNICDINNANVESNNASGPAATATSTTTTENLSTSKSHNFDESCAVAPSQATATTAAVLVCNSQQIMTNTSPIQAIFREIVPQYFR